MLRQSNIYVTPEEYLTQERSAEYKSEYLNGEVFAMSGASRRHNLISTNLIREFSLQVKGRPCEVYGSDMRVGIRAANVYTYPDVTVVCGEAQLEDKHLDTLLNPTLIVEVLSKSTGSYDRRAKFGYYRTIASLAEYVLVAQDERRVELNTKQEDGRWLLTDFRSASDAIELASINCVLALAEVYDKVALA